MAQTSAPSTCAWRVYLVYVERVCVKSHFFYALRDFLLIEHETRGVRSAVSRLSVNRRPYRVQRTPSSDEKVERDGRRSLTLSVVRTSLRETATGATCAGTFCYLKCVFNCGYIMIVEII